jgi:hypothetical protein
VFTNDFKQSLAFANEFRAGKYSLKMRTFEAVMYGAAKEQAAFKRLAEPPGRHIHAEITYQPDDYGTIAYVSLPDHTPFAVRPILTIQYRDKERARLTKLTEVTHGNVTYSIGDLTGNAVDLDPLHGQADAQGTKTPDTENRTVFTIISYLFSQTAINTQNLPVQQLIQVQ